MIIAIEVNNCAECPASSFDEGSVPFCNVLMYNILKEGEKDYSAAYLGVYPDIPLDCPFKSMKTMVMGRGPIAAMLL